MPSSPSIRSAVRIIASLVAIVIQRIRRSKSTNRLPSAMTDSSVPESPCAATRFIAIHSTTVRSTNRIPAKIVTSADQSTSKSTATSTSNQTARRRIAIVFTGGTIAVNPNKGQNVTPQLSGKEILARIPEIEQYLPNVDAEIHDFSTLPGPHMSPEMMLTLTAFLRVLAETTDGIVITHGTDSIEETAYFLDIAIGNLIPAVLTGSMHTSTDAAWDGGRNLIDAIGVAASGLFENAGTVVVMNGTIHAASEVIKYHTMRTDTFRSPNFGQLGTVNMLAYHHPERSRGPKSRISIPVSGDVDLPYIELLQAYSGMEDTLFTAALNAGAAGIVIEAMGQGNVPPGAINGIARAIERKIPVIIASRCPSGPVRPYYTYEGAGRELERLGCLFAPYLTGPKARLKLMLALASGYNHAQLSEIFQPG